MVKKIVILFIAAIILVIAVVVFIKIKPKANLGDSVKEISPIVGAVKTSISTTGTVLPKNRLEIKPPVGGRIESVLVKEGEKVKVGQTLVWMSSTERAALLDAAQGQGAEKLKYWQEAYKPIALLAPIDGEVIVATTQPGQTVTTADAAVVLSDHLIVRAQVDETDIGKITQKQNATISLDAYPDTKIKAQVEHIYYESKTVNNVTIYEVDLYPEDIPLFFRSGMNATVDFVIKGKEGAILIPEEAVSRENKGNFVSVKQADGKELLKVSVELGLSDGKNIEVISGLKQDDLIVMKANKYSLPKKENGKNPFMPGR